MFERNKLSAAVTAALSASALGTATTALPVWAEDGATEIEEVVVTGSRIKRAVDDEATPVTVINATDLEVSGYNSVADVLRNTTYNSFGSFRERSGSSYGQIALVDLRGLGPERSAVLVNGRRVPGNPFTGRSAVDLNSIPLTAIERIEILTDSASAVYGADAIGGVINFIMRDDYNGAEIQVGMTRPEAEGADEEQVKALFGASSDRGKVLASMEFYERGAIFDGDRDYSAVQINGTSFGDTVGVSVGGNTGFPPNFSTAYPIGDCDPAVYAGVFTTPFGIPGEGCGFGYADISAQTGAVERYSTFVDASYNLTDDITVYAENRYSRINSFGRYAPAVGFFGVNEPARIENGLTPVAGANGAPFLAFHRFVAHGPRDDNTTRDEFDVVVGMEGDLADGRVSFDAFARHYFYSATEEGNTYILTNILEDLAATGAYDVLDPLSPANADAVLASSATLTRDLDTQFNQVGITLSGFAFDLPAGQIGWAFGGEWAEEDYNDNYDRQREAGNVIGSAGNSAAGDRSRKAVYGELLVPVAEGLELGAAVRWDDYNDFGSAVTPSVNIRWNPNFADWLVVRASYNEGFKAPSLTELYSKLSQSFNNVTDFPQCESQGVAPVDCPTFQVENFTGGNLDLEAEESEAYNIGLVVTPTFAEGLSLSVDYFEVDTLDRATALRLSQIVRFAAEGNLPPGTSVMRGAPGPAGGLGRLVSIVNVRTNAAAVDIKGIDVRAQYNGDFDFGDIHARMEWSHFNSYEFQNSADEDVNEFLSEGGYPEGRVNAQLRLTRDSFTVNYSVSYISEHGDGEFEVYDRYMTHDITVEYRSRWGVDLTFGVQNFTDEEPIIDGVGGYDDAVTGVLYDLAGRRYFARAKYTFN